jgi:hypothetical protein
MNAESPIPLTAANCWSESTMSISPNDAFDNDFDGGAQTTQAPPSKSGKGCLIAVVVVFLLLVLVCCGGGIALFFVGTNALGEVVITQVENDPAIAEYIGEVESCSLDFGETAKAAESAEQAGDQTPMAFEIKGSKGEGTLLLMQEAGNQEAFSSGTLVLPDGNRVPLQSLGQADDSLDLDMDLDIGDLIDEGDPSSGGTVDDSDAPKSDAEDASTAAEPQTSATDDAKETSPK